MTGQLAVTGSLQQPRIRIRPQGSRQDAWAKRLYRSRWVTSRRCYEVRSLSRAALERARGLGFTVLVDPALGCDVEDLFTPLGELAPEGTTVLVSPRLVDYDRALELAGSAAIWSKAHGRIVMPLSDASRGGIAYTSEVLEAFERLRERDPRRPGVEDLAAYLASLPAFTDDDDDLPRVPDSFGVSLFAHQEPAALAVLYGHRLLADPPGVGKSLTLLAAAALSRPQRVLIACPPVAVTHWGREIVRSGLDAEPTLIRARGREPERLGRFVVAPDSLLTSRSALRSRLVDWAPQIFAVDEAHRLKNSTSKRSAAMLELGAASTVSIPITGTPIISGPHELVPLLELTGHMLPVFGGASRFLDTFCTRDRWGKFHARKATMARLNELLIEHVMVRRRKSAVLPFLPKRFHTAELLDVDMKRYRDALRDVIDRIRGRHDGLIDEGLDSDEAWDVVRQGVGQLVAPLRRAAAMAKVDAAVEQTVNVVASGNGPVVLWAHHHEVQDALLERLAAEGVTARALTGRTSDRDRQAAIDAFQEGQVSALVAGITAAGVAVTLTAGNIALFVESDWTPALVSQAIDRMHRIGQQRAVHAQTLVALGTIDEHMQRVLEVKGVIADTIQGGDREITSVVEGELMTPRELVDELIRAAS